MRAEPLIALLTALYVIYLLWEAHSAARARAKLRHVVHVNGTRGKSTVSRLIEAGLRAGGLAVFCKTTGTVPITIEVDGVERPIRRIGCANIREQLRMLHRAAAQGAEVMVVECMAVLPELQYAAQHRILQADIGVITNVRRDHTDVMGETLPEIAQSLSNTVPRGGILFTAEDGAACDVLAAKARSLGTELCRVRPDGTEPRELDFPENVALALAVCVRLGVPREKALEGMRRFHPDPYALAVYRVGDGRFINGFSINDPQSTRMVYDRLRAQLGLTPETTRLLINNRMDRGARTRDMAEFAVQLAPREIQLLGAGKGYVRRALRRAGYTGAIMELNGGTDARALAIADGETVFAVGNIANDGKALISRVREEGERIV